MGKQYDRLILELEGELKRNEEYKKIGILQEKHRYQTFGMIYLALCLQIINNEEYDKLCDKYFDFK